MRNAGMAMAAAIVTTLVLVSFSSPAFAQDLKPLPLRFENLDLNGTWNFTTSQPTVSGGCPAGNAMAGTATVTQQGPAVTFRYASGARCQPAAVCSYTGTIDPEENQFVVSNSVDVDEEGGNVSSAIRLTVYNNELADGEGTNNYVHPEGFECRWDMDLVLTREPETRSTKIR